MGNILVVGSINMDVVIKLDHIPSIGETILTNTINNYNGGKGANQAVAASKLGGNVFMIGKLGNDSYGSKLYENLKANNVNVDGIEFEKSMPSGTAYIYVDGEGKNTIVVVPGANQAVDREQIDRHKYLFDKAEYCLIQLEIPLDTVAYTIEICHKRGIKVILNPAPANKLSDEVLSKVYMITPNESELNILTGLSTDTQNEINLAAKKLTNKGIANVVTTLGEKGCFYANNHESRAFNAIKVEAKDTTAAGDSFTAALAVALSEDKNIEEAINFATHVSAMVVTKEGAQTSLPLRDDVEKFMITN